MKFLKIDNNLQKLEQTLQTRELNDRERSDLMDVLDSLSNDTQEDVSTKVRINLLLGDQEKAEHYFEKLSIGEQKELKKQPVWNLWNSRGKNHNKIYDSIIEIAEANNGFVTSRQVDDFGFNRSELSRLVERGALERSSEGVYILPYVIMDDMYLSLQNKYTKGIFSLNTSLYLHGLTDRTPSFYQMAFPFGYNSKTLSANKVRASYELKKFYGKGSQTIETPSGNLVSVYCAERTLCDIMRPKNKVDIDTVANAYKAYFQSGRPKFDIIMQYADLLGVKSKVRSYLEVLQ
jgi:hypothetical protein